MAYPITDKVLDRGLPQIRPVLRPSLTPHRLVAPQCRRRLLAWSGPLSGSPTSNESADGISYNGISYVGRAARACAAVPNDDLQLNTFGSDGEHMRIPRGFESF
jgi:hypothetical protein